MITYKLKKTSLWYHTTGSHLWEAYIGRANHLRLRTIIMQSSKMYVGLFSFLLLIYQLRL